MIVTPDGRYLLQQRDDDPRIPFPNAWALFGGQIEPRESPAEALVRELEEEIGFAPARMTFFTQLLFDGMDFDPGVRHRYYFEVPIEPAVVPTLTQHEGQAMKLLAPADIYAMAADIIPFDQVAVHLHILMRRRST